MQTYCKCGHYVGRVGDHNLQSAVVGVTLVTSTDILLCYNKLLYC